MARKSRLGLTEDERKRFDDIGLDQINQMSDVKELHRLMQYMECVPRLPSPSSRLALARKATPVDPRDLTRVRPPVLEPRPSLREEGFPQTAQVVKNRMHALGTRREDDPEIRARVEADVGAFVSELAAWTEDLKRAIGRRSLRRANPSPPP